jgi:hypothetical protein
VRSLTAIICLTAFFALQYGKLVSYWHCKFASIYTSTRCDCVQQLLESHNDENQHTTATIKEKTEEIVFFYEGVQSWQSPQSQIMHDMAWLQVIPQIYAPAVFQPPRTMLNA